MRTQHKQILIIAAISSRPYVKAAVDAGYDVIALDCFADVDTQHLAKKVVKITAKNGQLAGEQILELILSGDLQHAIGFCYGAGFEMQPQLLSKIGQYVTILGNTDDVVRRCKDPRWFFKCCDNLDVPYPDVKFSQPKQTNGWLQKTIGGSGGAHIKRLSHKAQKAVDNSYFQQQQPGKPVSCLFIADTHGVEVVGFNEQWLDESAAEPFRFGGAVSHAEISEHAKELLTTYIRRLTLALGLVGLNSCDAICDGDDVYVLEVNPRLSATLDLYASTQTDLMTKHIVACGNGFKNIDRHPVDKRSHAYQVCYATQDILIKQGATWPAWVSDVPETGDFFASGMPICTVSASAETANLAKRAVQNRVAVFSCYFLN